MCGRFVSVSTPEQLAEAFEVDEVRTESQGARYNVAPTLDVYSVIERDGQRRLGTLRWGFVPFWAKSLQGPRPINARVETIAESSACSPRPSRSAAACCRPTASTSGRSARAPRKQPWYIHDPDDEPLAFAGIWTVWRDPGADASDARPVFSTRDRDDGRGRGGWQTIHDRMPVMLPDRSGRVAVGRPEEARTCRRWSRTPASPGWRPHDHRPGQQRPQRRPGAARAGRGPSEAGREVCAALNLLTCRRPAARRPRRRTG